MLSFLHVAANLQPVNVSISDSSDGTQKKTKPKEIIKKRDYTVNHQFYADDKQL